MMWHLAMHETIAGCVSHLELMVGLRDLVGYSTMHEVLEITSIRSRMDDIVHCLFPMKFRISTSRESF
jgi:hypothetical protein